MSRANLFHIVAAPDWDTALISGTYAPASLETQGFVHLSESGQVAAVADEWYPGADGLVVVELDPALLEGEIVDEDLYGHGTLFPHLYGPVATAAAVAIHPLPRDSDGRYVFAG